MRRNFLTQSSQICAIRLREQAVALFAAGLSAGRAGLPGAFLDER